MIAALLLCAVLQAPGAQDVPVSEPRRAPVVGVVDLKSWVEVNARLISAEALLKECQEQRRRRHPLRRLLRAIFGR